MDRPLNDHKGSGFKLGLPKINFAPANSHPKFKTRLKRALLGIQFRRFANCCPYGSLSPIGARLEKIGSRKVNDPLGVAARLLAVRSQLLCRNARALLGF